MEERQNATGRKPYEPPKATFVSLKLEERLMACGKAQPTVKNCRAGLNRTS